MKRIALVVASAVINACTIPAVASDCISAKDLDASRARWTTLLGQPADLVDQEKTCRAYAISFYESVTLRQAIAHCVDGERRLALLDSKINALNDLISTKCGN
jgi:hypothetical protein